MRRKDREVTDLNQIFEIVRNCSVAHIGMVDASGKPYVVALNFGWERQEDTLILYFHSAYAGRKAEILKQNPAVFFQMDCGNTLVAGTKESPCTYSWRYNSVMGSGRAEFIENAEEKAHALNRIIQHLEKTEERYRFPQEILQKTCVYRVCCTDMTGKRHE